ncbi:hypothetical protein IWW50_004333 [Coemansia erecta]|nr:hypothetical protein IWW50_004333 [Coemansia erecta]
MGNLFISTSQSDVSDRVLFAVLKKGCLYNPCLRLLNNIGIEFNRKPRHVIKIVLLTNI